MNNEKNEENIKGAKDPQALARVIFSVMEKYMSLKNYLDKMQKNETEKNSSKEGEKATFKAILEANSQNPPQSAPNAEKSQETVDLNNLNQEFQRFFEPRSELFNYLKKYEIACSAEDLKEICALCQILENKAIQVFKKSIETPKAIEGTPNSISNMFSGKNTDFNRVFTKNDIAKMSGADFLKNEKAIFKLLNEGKLH